MKLGRRDAVALSVGLSASLCAALAAPSAWAARGPRQGGTLRLSLPCDLGRIDPHDPTCLLGALIGPSLFETLYGATGGGTHYPTLAASLPKAHPGGFTIPLRAGLAASDGSALDAKAIALSLSRSQKENDVLAPLGQVSVKGSGLFFKTGATIQEITALLTSPQSAVVPQRFNPQAPVTTGALRPIGSGVRTLVQNGFAPRGSSHLSQVLLRSGSLTDCLRDFERGTSDLSLLGSSLYKKASHVTEGTFDLGWVALLGGSGLGEFGRPGVLQSALSHLPTRGLQALGVQTEGEQDSWSWQGPAFSILVDETEPWLKAIAEELARLWQARGSNIQVEPRSRSHLVAAMKRGDYGARLVGLRNDGPPGSAIRQLYHLAQARPPRGKLPESPQVAARSLRVGIVGKLAPSGAARGHVTGLLSEGRLSLESCEVTGK